MDVKTFTIPPIENNEMKQFFRDVKSPEVVDQLVRMSKGNPGGATVLAKLFEGVDLEEAKKDVNTLDEAEIYGGNLWIGFKDLCSQDIEQFRKKLKEDDLVEQIKKTRYFITYE